MNKFILIIATTLLLLSSCATTKKVIYFQDVQSGDTQQIQSNPTLQFREGDRLSIIVTSAQTPELAIQFNLPVVTMQAGATNQSTYNQIAYYTIDENGCIDVPSVGRLKITGLTRSQVSDLIRDKIRGGGLCNDAVVTVSTYDQYVTIMGEVARPGRVSITRDNINLLEALGQVGDLTIYGRRDRVLVIREENGTRQSYYVDLRSKNLFNSPVYNLKQNDIVYVEPNKIRTGQSTVNDNSVRSISTWLSISSFLTSLAILIFR